MNMCWRAHVSRVAGLVSDSVKDVQEALQIDSKSAHALYQRLELMFHHGGSLHTLQLLDAIKTLDPQFCTGPAGDVFLPNLFPSPELLEASGLSVDSVEGLAGGRLRYRHAKEGDEGAKEDVGNGSAGQQERDMGDADNEHDDEAGEEDHSYVISFLCFCSFALSRGESIFQAHYSTIQQR